MTKRRKTIEKPDGRGEIRLADSKVIKVCYSLVVLQTFQSADDGTETDELAGQVEIRGAIEVNIDQGMVDLSGKHFTLKTNDGRCLEA